MKFIEALKLKSKLFLLFVLITLALFILGFMGRMYVQSMKKNMDALYFGTFVPITELYNIINTYNATISNIIYKAKYKHTNNKYVTKNIKNAIYYIQENWNSYITHYKTKEELEYVKYATKEIAKTNEYLEKIVLLAKNKKNLSKISIETFDSNMKHINEVIKRLLKYELETAKFNRKEFLNSYHTILRNITIILLFIIIAILGVTYYVFRSVQSEHTKLEIATKKLKKLNKKLENASFTDSLTTLYNRRYFNIMYDKELKRAKRDKKYITFMMIDIDFFKQYNDTYGHIEGDNTLKAVASVIKKSFKRPSDYTFRLGGEEFGVLLSDVDELNSARLAKMLCKDVKALKIEHKGSKVSDVVTISVGVICCIANENIEDNRIITRADEMLYRAKESGRNRYIITTSLYDEEESNNQ